MCCARTAIILVSALFLVAHVTASAGSKRQQSDFLPSKGRYLQQFGSEENAELVAEEQEREQELEEEKEKQIGTGTSSSSSKIKTAEQSWAWYPNSFTAKEEPSTKALYRVQEYFAISAEQDVQAAYEEELEREEEDEEGQSLYSDDYTTGDVREELEKLEEEEAEEELEESESGGLTNKAGGKEVSSQETDTLTALALQDLKSKANSTSNSTKESAETEAFPFDESIERAVNAHLEDGGVSGSKNVTQLAAAKTQDALSQEKSGSSAYEELSEALAKGKSSEDLSGEELAAEEEALYEQAAEQFEDTLSKDQSTGLPGKGSSDTLQENRMKTSNISLAATSDREKPKNVSIMTQGAILGTTIGGMVKDNSSSIAGVVGILIAGGAGVAVAFAGISLYQRFKNRRSSSKSLPRIIEIGALSGRKQKSPSYARVNDKNQDQNGPSGARWPDSEAAWDDGSEHQDAGASGAGVKHKKAWDWDADW